MGEFHEHYRQKLAHLRHLPLCKDHIERCLVSPHEMVSIEGMGTECVWCGTTDTDDVHTPADFLVDLQCPS